LSKPGRKLRHHTKQSIFTIDNWTIEFFSFDSWFTVSADIMEGRIGQYYCNINEPAKIQGNMVSFVDLDLDYVQRNGEWMVVDEDEFVSNAVKFSYPNALIHRAKAELVGLQTLISKGQFPFDGTLDRFILNATSDSR
jgi:protein associated with RNAse G/E